MMSQPDALAFLLEEAELGQIVPGWPARLRLAVCLDQDGGCMMLVHHADEAGRILERIAEAIQQPVGTFCVVPGQPGCPTRRMLFSEEQRLLALVASSEGLLETAEDYAINYSFAAEEGLDPEFLTTGSPTAVSPGRRSEAPAGAQPERHLPGPVGSAVASAARRLAEAQPEGYAIAGPGGAEAEDEIGARVMARALAATEGALGPLDEAPYEARRRFLPLPAEAPSVPLRVPAGAGPIGFRQLSETERRGGLFAAGVLSLGQAGRVVLTIGDATGDGFALGAEQAYFRDDLLAFAVPWMPPEGFGGMPGRLIFEAGLFPASMLAALEEAGQGAQVTASGEFLYVTLNQARYPVLAAPAKSDMPPASATVPAPGPAVPPVRPRGVLRALRTGVSGGVLALAVLLALKIGFAPTFGSADAHTDNGALRAAIFTPAPSKP